MSANCYYRYLLSISGQTQKEPFFSRAWGKANIISREAARQTVRTLRAQNIEVVSKRNQEVLGGFNARINEEHLDMLHALAEDTLAFLDAQKRAKMRRLHEAKVCTESMQRIMEEIVELLQPYAALMNRAVGDTELYTVTTGPEQATEVIRHPGNPDVLSTRSDFRARFSTRAWSLLFRGTENRIDVFLIPADKVLRLNKVETSYRPVALLQSRFDGTDVEWWIDGRPLDRKEFERLLINLYHDLLARSQALMFADHCQYTTYKTQTAQVCDSESLSLHHAMAERVTGAVCDPVCQAGDQPQPLLNAGATAEIPRFDGPYLSEREPFLFTGDQCDRYDDLEGIGGRRRDCESSFVCRSSLRDADFEATLKEAASPDKIRILMEAHAASHEEIVRVLGSKATLDGMLSGKRHMTKSIARKLARHFKIDATLLIAGTGKDVWRAPSQASSSDKAKSSRKASHLQES